MTCTSQDERVYYWPWSGVCFCESDDFLTKQWNAVEETGGSNYGREFGTRPTEQFGRVKQKMEAFKELAAEIEGALASLKPDGSISRLGTISRKAGAKRQASDEKEPTKRSMDGPRPSFLPPPNTNITPELINQSLSVQPENTATISSVLIHIPQGVLTVTFQMNGVIADSMSVNASTSMICGAIGSEPEPEIEIVPKAAAQGQVSNETAAAEADCLCIAVNMYNPNVINLWVMDRQGQVFALASSNKIVNIDQLDPGLAEALSLVPIPAGSQKRDVASLARMSNVIPLQTRQVLKVGCGRACPFSYMRHVMSADGRTCGCVFQHAGATAAAMGRRGVVEYWATMSKDECEAMLCLDSAGKAAAAVFNPFAKACWCLEPEYH
ncbi:hypothetical protein DV735_g2883, partial [Chaetothyriales sp. CBS 134920]